jgi:hypothetical protein
MPAGYGPDDCGSISDMRKRFFLCSTASRPALGLSQLPIQWVRGYSVRDVKLSIHLHVLPRSGMAEVYIYSHMTSCLINYAPGQLYFLLVFYLNLPTLTV